MSGVRKLAVVAASLAMTASIASPAHAERDAFKDRRGDIRGGLDIQRVKVTNNGPWVKIRTTHRNIKYGPHVRGGSISIYLDTIPRRKGPEFRLSAPVGFDGGIGIVKTRRWKSVTPGPGLGCRIRFNANYKKDKTWFAVRRVCLANAYLRKVGKIRVSADAIQQRRGPRVRHDWAPRYHRFYPWVRKG